MIYCDIEVDLKIREPISKKELVEQLVENKELIEFGSKEDSDGGSDSAPSEDNLDPEEMANLIPMKVNKRKPKQSLFSSPLAKRPVRQELQE